MTNKTESQKPAESSQPQSKTTKERIEILLAQIDKLNQEIRTVKGKISNRDANSIFRIKIENKKLENTRETLEKAFKALLTDAYKGRQSDELRQKYEVLRQSAIVYFKKNNIDPEIWKNIES